MPWKTVSLLWPAILAALLPLDLKTMLERWPRLLSRLASLDSAPSPYAYRDRAHPRQVERFRSWFGAELRPAG